MSRDKKKIYVGQDEDGQYMEFEELQRQLAEVTKERDQLRAALDLADALRNRERGNGK